MNSLFHLTCVSLRGSTEVLVWFRRIVEGREESFSLTTTKPQHTESFHDFLRFPYHCRYGEGAYAQAEATGGLFNEPLTVFGHAHVQSGVLWCGSHEHLLG